MTQTKKTITVNGKTLPHASDSPSILNSLEQQGVNAPYQCREGFCGACRARLCEGQVHYPHEPLAFIRDGDILTCCSIPITDITLSLED